MLLWAYIIFRNNSSNGTGKKSIFFHYYFFSFSLRFRLPTWMMVPLAFAYTAYAQGRLCLLQTISSMAGQSQWAIFNVSYPCILSWSHNTCLISYYLSHAFFSVYTPDQYSPPPAISAVAASSPTPSTEAVQCTPSGKTETNFALHWPLTNTWGVDNYMVFHVTFFMNMGCYHSTGYIARYVSVWCFKFVLHVPPFNIEHLPFQRSLHGPVLDT